MKPENPHNGSAEYEGYFIDLIDELSRIIGFEYDLTVGPMNAYGRLINGSWNGLMGNMTTNKADIGLMFFWIMSDRMDVVDYSIPFYDNAGLKILMKKPVKPNAFFKFLTVFESEVWVTMIGLYALTCLLLYFYDWKSPFSYRNNSEAYQHDDLEKERLFSLRECFWFGLMCLMPQGGGTIPKSE